MARHTSPVAPFSASDRGLFLQGEEISCRPTLSGGPTDPALQ
jgi:hypothetical protein